MKRSRCQPFTPRLPSYRAYCQPSGPKNKPPKSLSTPRGPVIFRSAYFFGGFGFDPQGMFWITSYRALYRSLTPTYRPLPAAPAAADPTDTVFQSMEI